MSRDDARFADAAAGGGDLQPEVAAFGEWNTSNLGDRGIHEGVLQFFGECGWRVDSYALGSLTPVSGGAGHGSIAPALPGRIGAALGKLPRLKCALRRIRQRVRMTALLPRLRPAQAIMVGGGELLSDNGLHFPQSLAVIGEASRRLDKPLLCLGCAVEGKWSAQGEEMVREFLARCSLVAARDRDSAERIAVLLGRPVPVFGDFCLNEGLLLKRSWSRRRRTLAINVQRVPRPWSQDCYEDALVALVERLMHLAVWQGLDTVRIFTTGTAEDALPAQRVFERLGGHGVELHVPSSLGELSGMLRECALVVASRLHAGILGLAEGAPAVGFCPQPKLRRFFSTVGIGDYSFDLNAGARLLHRLDEAGCAAIFAEQRDRVMHAPIWADRKQVRQELGLLAGRAARCE
ncbi:MAG TPA: polysaccharide pyruvyl transferase family protein [Burkholderiales bacterium]|nr:polysaccharide pyruvyl transferase family protein [Burkholderiales bacterium]